MRKLKHQQFDYDKFEEFYSDHYFEPHSDEGAVNAHELYPRIGWALDVARESGYKTVLDLGCLEGNCVLTLAKHAGCSGVGVDLSKDGVEFGKARAKKFKLPVEFYQMTLEAYLEGCVAKNEQFDMITAFEVMEHVKDPDLVFKLMDEVLAPGGQVLVSTPDFESPIYGKDDEENKCHIRLYTTADEDYEAVNKYGHTRTATSLSKAVGKERIIEMEVWSQLIHCRYK